MFFGKPFQEVKYFRRLQAITKDLKQKLPNFQLSTKNNVKIDLKPKSLFFIYLFYLWMIITR